MGVSQLPELVRRLVNEGRPSTTPVGIIERAHAPDQRVTVGTLDTIVGTAAAIGVTNPAIIVVGDVVSVPTMLATPRHEHLVGAVE
jgi:siroheme synthase